MKIVLFIFFAMLVFFILLIIPIRASAKFVLDLESKSVYYVILGAGLTLSQGKVYLLDDFSISLVSDSIFFMKMKQPNIEKYYMITSLLKKIKIEEVTILLDGGVARDAFLTSMAIGTLNAFYNSLAPRSRASKIDYDVRINPVYDDTNLNVAGVTAISVTILGLIVSMIKSKVKAKNYQKEKRYV